MASQPKPTTHSAGDLPPGFEESVLKPSASLPDGVHVVVKGYDFNEGLDYRKLLDSFSAIGFQSTHFARAVDLVNMMLQRKLQKPTEDQADTDAALCDDPDINNCRRTGCTIFLAYTSNMVTCGVRDTIRFLVQHRMVDVLVTSAGGVEEDFIKCLAPSYVGDFTRWSGAHLRDLGINRTGNILVPNDNYVKFEAWLMPLLDKMLEEQNTLGINWTPSKLIDRLGKEIDNPESIYYWCHKHQIPVFCPAITDGSLGDVLFSHTYSSPGLRVDVVEDIRRINRQAIYSKATGVLILGGGVVKHHTMNANLMRNGADYCVYINTGHEFDGSDAGASPDEAVSWGKLRAAAEPVKISADASLVFPLLVAQTFASKFHAKSAADK